MNLVGKIVIVLIFVMSIFFSALTVAVYSTHRNWKEVVTAPQTGLKDKLQAEKDRVAELESLVEEAVKSKDDAEASKQQALVALQTKIGLLSQERDKQEVDLAKLTEAERDAVASMEAAHQTLESLRGDVFGLQDEIDTARTERDRQKDEAVDATDKLQQRALEFTALTNASIKLTAKLGEAQKAMAAAKDVLRKYGLSEAIPVAVEDVDGDVLASRANGMIEISIGSDDGVFEGQRLEVYRGANLLGRVEVVEIAPDKAVCKILPQFLKGPIQEGDSVTSKF